jgi:hypothetical protein
VANVTPRPLYTRECLGTGGCVGPRASLLIRRIVRNHECSAKCIICGKLIGNNVEVREVFVIWVELLLTISLDTMQQSRKDHLVSGEVYVLTSENKRGTLV